MIKTEALHRIIEDEGIYLVYQALPGGLDGMYHVSEGSSAILISEKVIINERQYRTVLAEEIGHYFTCSWDSVSRRRTSIAGRIKYEKAELKALRWAADYMIPTDLLLAFICSQQPVTLSGLAEKFEVEESLVRHKLEAMAAVKYTWNLTNGKRLVLANLPDVYLFEAF